MANLIQIKRSETAAAPGALANGELGYTSNGDILYIGSASSVVPIAGKRFPGTLTANQALVANATGYIDAVKTAKLLLTDTTANVTHINAVANSTTLGGAVNTEITTTWAIKTYVDEKTSSLGGSITNTHIVYSNSGTFSGSAAFTFNDTTNTVSISLLSAGNTTVTGFANISSTLAAGNTTVTGFANISSTLAAGNTTITGFANISSTLAAGNTTVTGFANISSTLAAGNTTVTGFANVSGDLTVGGNTTIGSNIADDRLNVNAKVDSSLIPFHSSTYALGNSSFTWSNVHTATIHSGTGNFSGNVTVDGDLLVSGDVVTINTTNLNIEDPLVKLANGNSTTDAVDIGLFGTFGNATVTQHTGLFRDASDSEWKLFSGNIPSLSTATTVDTANVNFALANLQVFKITANTVASGNVQITGGQITGIVDLTVADGGTGVSVFANNGIIYGQNTSALAVTAAGTEGQVLQAGAGGVPVFASLDGGTF